MAKRIPKVEKSTTEAVATIAPEVAPPTLRQREQIEWENERRRLLDVTNSSLNNFLRSSVYQRSELLRDTLAVAVTVLVGALTLYLTTLDNPIIKTKSIFFVSIFVLAAGIIANLVARLEIVKHIEDVSYQIESFHVRVSGASRVVVDKPDQTNIDTVWRLENERPAFPNLRKRGEYGPAISVWTIVISVLGVGLSIVLKIGI